MFYFGCLPLLAIILIMVVLSLVRNLFKTAFDVLLGAYLTFQDWVYGLFRPSPIESEIEDPNYYHPTEEREKLYSDKDGEYVKFKNVKEKA